MTKIPFNEAKHGNKLSLQCLLLSIEGISLIIIFNSIFKKNNTTSSFSGNNEHHRISIIRNK